MRDRHHPLGFDRFALMLAWPLAPADREIEIGFGEVHPFVGADQHETQLAVATRDFGEARHQPFGGEIARRGDGQRLGRLPGLHRADRFLELQESVA